MTLKTRIQSDMKVAMKAGDKDRLKVVRLILAAVKQVEVDERRELDDPAVVAVLNKMVKQRRDSITQFSDGGRDDLAALETAEIGVIESYLPEPLSEDELGELIDKALAESGATTVRDMGRVMAIVKDRAAGRADLGAVSARVKARLAG
ncbi:MAG TPA: GatB/YqeY domain-containing protein [Woeseiaceae bacterium]|nr:GatB/YqeY domain-containing protein [Woeseiaceae bacterium]